MAYDLRTVPPRGPGIGWGATTAKVAETMDYMKDEPDYVKEDRQDLVARLMAAQLMGQALLKGYSALRHYGVDFMKLPEWLDQSALDEARRLKPHKAQEKIVAYFERLLHAISAAVRRKQFSVIERDTTHDDA